MGPTASLPLGPIQVQLMPVLRDNYVFVLQRGGRAVVVDPAIAEPVINELERQGLELEAILQTHHHSDHIGGTPQLRHRWPAAAVIGPACEAERIPQTQGVRDGERLTLLGEPVDVLAVPGHTRGHVAYHLPQSGHLFCGDTLFAGGCGRLFEGTPAQMHHALQRLAGLPPATLVWCAHEYTEGNLRWAAHLAPDDGAIAERPAAVGNARRAGQPTIPSSIALERATNLFVRAADAEELAALRQSKDHWAG
jgi:hydroxyacylglutathione hydrolase